MQGDGQLRRIAQPLLSSADAAYRMVEWLAIARMGDAVRRPEVVTVPQCPPYHGLYGSSLNIPRTPKPFLPQTTVYQSFPTLWGFSAQKPSFRKFRSLTPLAEASSAVPYMRGGFESTTKINVRQRSDAKAHVSLFECKTWLGVLQ